MLAWLFQASSHLEDEEDFLSSALMSSVWERGTNDVLCIYYVGRYSAYTPIRIY